MAHLVKPRKGRKYYTIRDYDPVTGKRPEYSTGTGDEKRARAKLVTYLGRKEAGLALEGRRKGVSLTRLLEARVAWLRGEGMAEGTIEQTVMAVTSLRKFLDNRDRVALTSETIEKYKDHQLNVKKRKRGGINSTLGQLRALFIWAALRGLHPPVKIRMLREGETVPRAWDAEQVQALYAAAGDDLYLQMVLEVFLYTGARRSEAARLRKREINFFTGEILFERTKRRKERLVPIDDQTRKLLWRHIGKAAPEDPVFHHNGAQLFTLFRNLAGKAGIKDPHLLTLHSLRHTYVSHLLSMGYDIVTVSKLIGHKKPSMTLDRYGHLIPGRKREAVESLRKSYGR